MKFSSWFATAVACLLFGSPIVQAQNKFFSTSSRGGAEGARQNAQMTAFQSEFQRMNACTAAGMIYAPTHSDADAAGCTDIAGIRLLADELRVTGSSPFIRFSADGAPAGQRNYQIQNSGGTLYFAPTDDDWAWQGGGYITMDRNLNLGVYNNISVGGYAKLGTSTEACAASTEGAIRYNGTDKLVELCNGTDWVALGAGGGGGSLDIVGGLHSSDQCTTVGGEVVTISGGDKVCRFNGANCASGWIQHQNWSTTSAKSCQSSPYQGYSWQRCTTGSHAWSNKSRETCSYCGPDATGMDTCAYNATCIANVTQIGCF